MTAVSPGRLTSVCPVCSGDGLVFARDVRSGEWTALPCVCRQGLRPLLDSLGVAP